MRDSNQLGNFAYELLQELDGAGADQIPHQVVSPFQRWVTGLGINNTIFFRADHVANYELATFDLQNYVQNLNDPSQSLLDAMATVDWPFRRVTVPSQAMGMLPHFAIVGHELGHAIQGQNQIDMQSYSTILQASLADANARLANEGISFDQRMHLRWQDALSSWTNEIWSDAVGHNLVGPAFFFALGAFFELSGGGWGIGLSHPPSVLRRKLAWDRLINGSPSHAQVFETATGFPILENMNSPHLTALPSADDIYGDLKQKIGAVDAAISVALMPAIEALADEIYAEAERVLQSSNPEMIYSVERLQKDLENYLEPLCGLVPPIEHRDSGVPQASTLAGVLNVGWAALLCKLDEFSATLVDGESQIAMKMEKLQELLLKGLELSEARQLWEET